MKVKHAPQAYLLAVHSAINRCGRDLPLTEFMTRFYREKEYGDKHNDGVQGV
jgi:hypothetical protein